MKITIPSDIRNIHKLFKQNGYKLYLVGGAIRDALMNKTPKDFDLVTNATPDQVLDISKKAGLHTTEVGKSFGVVIINGHEIATFRKDLSGGRRPTGVEYTDIFGDVSRRDLTINALFYDLDKNEIVDLIGGTKDIHNKIIRSVGDASLRFEEDPLRKLRALRFAVTIDGKLDKSVEDALKKDPSLNGVSAERIRDEFIKSISKAKSQKTYLTLLDKLDMFKYIFPGAFINKVYINNSNYEIIIALLLSKFAYLGNMYTYLNKLTYTVQECRNIAFLIGLVKFNPENIYTLKTIQKNTTISNKDIMEFGKALNIDFNKFIKFKLSVKSTDFDASIKGAELGKKIKELETLKYISESTSDTINNLLLLEYSASELLANADREPEKDYSVDNIIYAPRQRTFVFFIKDYKVGLRLDDIRLISRLKGSDIEKLEIAINSDIKVNCTCPSYLYYGYKYMGTQLDYSYNKENRPPDIRNPKQDGTVCKHLVWLLTNIDKYYKDMQLLLAQARVNYAKKIYSNVRLN